MSNKTLSVPRELLSDVFDELTDWNSPNAKRLRALLAKPAEQPQGSPIKKIHIEVRECEGCNHIGVDDSHSALAACHKCEWSGPEPVEDKCPGCDRENCMAAACPDCGSRYVLAASKEFEVPAAQPQGEPVYMVRTHGSCCWEEVGSGSLEDFQSMPEEYELRALYTRPAEQPEPISSTSDKYKAELYDEVWQLARDMGFGNVTDALMKLNKQTAPVAVVLPERIDESICRGHSLTLAIKWNRCLDEVARLNPPQQ